jgi:hypothetical protein
MWKKLLALAFCLVVGCEMLNPIGPAIQLGIYWMNGETHKYYNTDQKEMVLAVKAALKELDIAVTEEEVNGDVIVIRAGGKVFVTDGDLGSKDVKSDDRFKIKVKAVKSNTTLVSIRANFFGDKEYSKFIYRHIDAQPKIKQFVTLQELKRAVN